MATTQQVVHSKEYETIYVLRSDVDAESVEKIQNRFAEVVEREAGKLVKVEAWGRRKLAYPVRKQRRGVYMYCRYVGRGGIVQELERNLRLLDAVIKFQTVVTSHVVDITTLTVDPESVKFQKIELAPEEEEKDSREKALGLVDLGPDAPRSRKEDRYDDFDADEFDRDGEGKGELEGDDA